VGSDGCWRCEWNDTGFALTTMMGFDMLCCGVGMNDVRRWEGVVCM